MTIKEKHVSEFSGFSFFLKYSRLVAKEAVTQKHQTAQTPDPHHKISPNKTLLFQAKGPGKRQERKRLDNNYSTPAKHHRKIVAPPACKVGVGYLDFHPH